MKRRFPTVLAHSLQCFFQDYLPTQRGMSLHTIRSYRDAMLLFLRFMAKDTRRKIEALEISDFTVERVTRFLRHLEINRRNGIKTRNARLAALHTFARFLIMSFPERMATYQRILSIPFKRGAERRPVHYLEMSEVEALLNAVDRTTPTGRRDYALFALMLNTGARIQEVLNLKCRDVRLDPPHQVRLLGKGNKVRTCPIWPRTAKLLQNLVSERVKSPDEDLADSYLFKNNRGEQLTRFGARYLLRKYSPKPIKGADRPHRGLHPHCIRHTTAVYLLKAGVDLAIISQWLGHAGLNTTMHYARADMDLKRQALSQVFPETLAAPIGGRVRLDGTEISNWMRRL